MEDLTDLKLIKILCNVTGHVIIICNIYYVKIFFIAKNVFNNGFVFIQQNIEY